MNDIDIERYKEQATYHDTNYDYGGDQTLYTEAVSRIVWRYVLTPHKTYPTLHGFLGGAALSLPIHYDVTSGSHHIPELKATLIDDLFCYQPYKDIPETQVTGVGDIDDLFVFDGIHDRTPICYRATILHDIWLETHQLPKEKPWYTFWQ